MNHAETETDAELLRRARARVAPAFAVLVHRYAALLHAAASPEGGGAAHLNTVRRTFLRAMRRLDAADDTALGTWLLDLQGTPLSDDDADRAAPLATAELDQLWGELAPCWPRGRRPRRPPRWLGQVAIVLLLLALSVAVPYALLVTAADEEDDPPAPVEEVVAVPIEDDAFDLRFEDAPAGPDGAAPAVVDPDDEPAVVDPDDEPADDPDDEPEGT